MVIYKCDWCEKEQQRPFDIILKGYAGGGGILIPANLCEYVFCCGTCLIEFMKKNANLTEKVR